MTEYQRRLRADLQNTVSRLQDKPEMEATLRRTLMREVSALALALLAEELADYFSPSPREEEGVVRG